MFWLRANLKVKAQGTKEHFAIAGLIPIGDAPYDPQDAPPEGEDMVALYATVSEIENIYSRPYPPGTFMADKSERVADKIRKLLQKQGPSVTREWVETFRGAYGLISVPKAIEMLTEVGIQTRKAKEE